MTDLPEDLNRWPTDPFEVLSLDRTADARTARRAYFKLVRKYQPDRFPAEFQKVREAYESVENWLKWRQDDIVDDDNDDAIEHEPELLNSSSGSADLDHASDFDESSSAPVLDVSSHFQSNPFDQFIETLESGDVDSALGYVNKVDPSAGPSQTAKAYFAKYFLSRFLSEDQRVQRCSRVIRLSQERRHPRPSQSTALWQAHRHHVGCETRRCQRLRTLRQLATTQGRFCEVVLAQRTFPSTGTAPLA